MCVKSNQVSLNVQLQDVDGVVVGSLTETVFMRHSSLPSYNYGLGSVVTLLALIWTSSEDNCLLEESRLQEGGACQGMKSKSARPAPISRTRGSVEALQFLKERVLGLESGGKEGDILRDILKPHYSSPEYVFAGAVEVG